jgi:hypothetical protein
MGAGESHTAGLKISPHTGRRPGRRGRSGLNGPILGPKAQKNRSPTFCVPPSVPAAPEPGAQLPLRPAVPRLPNPAPGTKAWRPMVTRGN